MLRKKGNILIAALATILCLMSAAYISCTKPGAEPSCNGVICQNGGYCNTKGKCVCPSGFEGTNCATKGISKFLGTWDVQQRIIGSDSAAYIGKDSAYSIFLKTTATPTTFFIDNFLGNPSYNSIVGALDSLNSSAFVLDTVHDYHMWFDHVSIRLGSYGVINSAGSEINGRLILRHLNRTYNWQIDTLSLYMTRHGF